NDAITASAPGDTVTVLAGSYSENVVLNKQINLKGAQAGVDACGRVATESILTAVGTLIQLVTGSANSTIDGLTLTGGNRQVESTSGPIDNLQILNNRFVGFTGSGIFLNDNGTNITVSQNYVDGSTKVTSGDLVHLDTDNFRGFQLTFNCI